ncbi:MAG: transporter substrate-binding domain-containing protein [Hyphomicrobium sp.]|uniref:transporter substrate-binding domain-containing protein n=1 Tax=Hyphomicrobium sp. TaxID=82 RepID=UPI001321F053|nr:transporter substrate-binding domain-containing protein [Hyphomicrobium sp.]KAB2941763.1 MAG: transporter substrate-binding domain-containing protein [Hyphomicrobium sp.]MBZ0210298.1 transporter substrate-binding domain-containing protein [Hyphomicrobium sp.]MCZ7596468.1 transporter substrate-binding domain-containing protein [Hyphomicrobium sp.]
MLSTILRRLATSLVACFVVLVAQPAIAVGQEETTEDAPAAAETNTDEPSRRVVVRFLTEGDFPPFNFYDEDGTLVGFNVDLARAICMELNTACDIKVRPWGELLLALRRGEADAVIAAHAVTPQSLAEVDFTDRYFQTPGRFAARRGGEAVEITPEALESKRIGVAKNTAHEAFLRTFFRSSAIQAFENADLARDALIQGQVDYIFDDGIGLVFWLHGTASKRCCELKGGAYLEPKYFGDGIAIAVPKTDSQIKTLINGALARLRSNGRLDELVERYFPVKVY